MKILIVRLSSFGDILQAQPCLSAIWALKPNATVDWLVRADFKNLLESQPLNQVIGLERNKGFLGLLKIIWDLSAQNYTHIYDAHNNVRSFWIRRLLPVFCWIRGRRAPNMIVRSKNRWRRYLFFKWRRPVFPLPFRGSHSFLEPLAAWGFSPAFLQQPHWKTSAVPPVTLPTSFVALAPSAAWETKRWPVAHWQDLIRRMNRTTFVILGGPNDFFCQEIASVAPERVINLAGKLSLTESCAVVAKAQGLISGDTGLLHAADQMRVLNFGLIGPTAFGYTSQNTSRVLETSLPCKPCSKDGRDRCTHPVFQKCMVDITPEQVVRALRLEGIVG